MMRVFLSRQFAAFLVTGGIAAAANFGSRILYSQWLGLSLAIVLAYLTGMTVAFLLARRFVFTDSGQTVRRSVLFFALVNVAAVFQTWAVTMLLSRYGLPAMGVERHVVEIAHAAGIVTPIFTSFIGHRRWSFKQRDAGPD